MVFAHTGDFRAESGPRDGRKVTLAWQNGDCDYGNLLEMGLRWTRTGVLRHDVATVVLLG